MQYIVIEITYIGIEAFSHTTQPYYNSAIIVFDKLCWYILL